MAIAVNCVADAVEGDSSLIVAFASQEGDMVDQHFGSAQAFYVYKVSVEDKDLITSQHFGYEKKDGNEDKLKPKLAWLQGSDVVYCGSIGGSATRQLVTLGVTPVQVKGGPDIDELLDSLQIQLRGEPEFWLANILKKKQKQAAGEERFDIDDDENWD